MKEKRKVQADLTDFSDGRDENNLAEFPISLLCDLAPSDVKTIEFEDTLDDWKTGKTIVRRVTITGSDKFGLPTAKDEEVLLALIQLTKIANDFTSPEVWFVKRDVLEILGWKNRGWAYDRVEESLHRWKGVSIHYSNSWRDHSKGVWRDSAAVGVIDYFTITDGRYRRISGPENGRGESRFCWNKLFFESFEAGYVKGLDFATYRGLHRPAAKRAYRFLDKRFWHKDAWEFDLRQFACDKLGFSRAYTTGQLKERLRPALGELEEIGYIESPLFRKERAKIWTVAVVKKAAKVEEDSRQVTAASPWISELERRGVNKKAASEIAGRYAAEFIGEKVAFVDWLLAKGDKRVSKSPAGFLVAAIRDNYPPSKDFLREKRPVAENQPKSTKKATASTCQVEVDATDHDPVDEVEQYLLGLSDAEQDTLFSDAIRTASPVESASLERLAAKGSELLPAMRTSLLRKYVRENGLAGIALAKAG